MINLQLKPCPCCKGEAEYYMTIVKEWPEYKVGPSVELSVRCKECRIRTTTHNIRVRSDAIYPIFKDSEEKLAENWNRRD